MATPDFYSILGVKRGAAGKEIQSAYRRLARKYHPDVTGGDKAAEEKFKAINEAYEVLSDEKKRAAFDKWGEQWMHAEQLEKMRRDGVFPGAGGVRFDIGDDGVPFGEAGVFDDLGGGGFGQMFDRFFRSSGPRARAVPQRGQDIRQHVTVSLTEAFQGATRTVQLQSQEGCPSCSGSGRIGSATCHVCQGAGRRAAGRRLEVKIPAGVESGTNIRLRGKGAPGRIGGPAGDVVLIVTVAEDPRFERRGEGLHVEAAISLTTAVLGGEVEVPTVTGQVLLRVPERTQNGRVFRLAGKGMPVMRSDKRGDLFAKVQVLLPEELSADERRLFEQLRELEGGAGGGDGAESKRRSA